MAELAGPPRGRRADRPVQQQPNQSIPQRDSESSYPLRRVRLWPPPRSNEAHSRRDLHCDRYTRALEPTNERRGANAGTDPPYRDAWRVQAGAQHSSAYLTVRHVQSRRKARRVSSAGWMSTADHVTPAQCTAKQPNAGVGSDSIKICRNLLVAARRASAETLGSG